MGPWAIRSEHADGITEVAVDAPPVNALDVAGWFELADTLTSVGRDPGTRVIVLRAEGRGFCAGVDRIVAEAEAVVARFCRVSGS